MSFRTLFLTLVGASCLGPSESRAQDVHFSQFWQAPGVRNPALISLAKGDVQATALYRNQWGSVGNAFSTALMQASYRMPFRVGNGNNDYLSFGLAAYSDRAGSLGLRTSAAYPAVTYNKNLGGERRSYLAVGLTGGYLQRSFDASKMTVDNQWVSNAYVASAATRENITNPTLQAWDVGVGVAYSSAIGTDNQHVMYAGVSAYNLTRPKWNFKESDPSVNRPTRFNANLGFGFSIPEGWRIEAQANFIKQGPATELMLGAIGSWQRDPSRFSDAAFSFGAGVYYRYQDALIPMVRVTYRTLTLTTTYDLNVSTLRAATQLRGGYEMSLTYSGLFSNSSSDREGASCPVF